MRDLVSGETMELSKSDLEQLNHCIPLQTTDDAGYAALLKQVRLENTPKNKVLFRQGDEDDDAVFLLSGEVMLQARGDSPRLIKSGTDSSRYPLSNLKPRHFSCKTTDKSLIARVKQSVLNQLLSWKDIEDDEVVVHSGYDVQDLEQHAVDEDADWMVEVLRHKAFARLPAANVQALFMRMEEVPIRAGETVIEEGTAGDHYYIVRDGSCVVERSAGSEPMILAELGIGDSFGEEALITQRPRNASVKMKGEGTVMRLHQRDFHKLLEEPLLSSVQMEEAATMVKARRACLLDVRSPDEYVKGKIRNSINIPMSELRQRLGELDPQQCYICYSDRGIRSASAAYILNERGFQAYDLRGGLLFLRESHGARREQERQASA